MLELLSRSPLPLVAGVGTTALVQAFNGVLFASTVAYMTRVAGYDGWTTAARRMICGARPGGRPQPPVWNSYKAIADACCDAWNKPMSTPERLASITRRVWAKAVSDKASGITP